MPGLDLYFAADTCFFQSQSKPFYKNIQKVPTIIQYEEEVFSEMYQPRHSYLIISN